MLSCSAALAYGPDTPNVTDSDSDFEVKMWVIPEKISEQPEASPPQNLGIEQWLLNNIPRLLLDQESQPLHPPPLWSAENIARDSIAHSDVIR